MQEAGGDSRQYSPSSIVGRDDRAVGEQLARAEAPAAAGAAAAQEPAERDRHVDADQDVGERRLVAGGAAACAPACLCCAHSGQRMPTDVGVMQSGQIGRPQFEHETPVSRPGWR